jgi:hypothetical protein
MRFAVYNPQKREQLVIRKPVQLIIEITAQEIATELAGAKPAGEGCGIKVRVPKGRTLACLRTSRGGDGFPCHGASELSGSKLTAPLQQGLRVTHGSIQLADRLPDPVAPFAGGLHPKT